jgi:radical SAM protein with 4Fe4S-binding SPASM domain
MIAYATRRIPNVSFLTNAFYLDDDMIDCFIENKVSYISVSFDGLGEVYEKVRHPAKFEENYNLLARLKEKKEAAGVKLPQVRVCTIWPAISSDPDAYYQTMKQVSDYVVYNPYINFTGPMTVKPDFICQYPWERMVVAYNGQAQCCTGWNADDIILGNLKDRTLKEMWHGELMERIRGLHSAGRRMELSSCADCRHGAKGDPNVSIDEILSRCY